MIKLLYTKNDRYDKLILKQFITLTTDCQENLLQWYINESDTSFEINLNESLSTFQDSIKAYCESNMALIIPPPQPDPEQLLSDTKTSKFVDLLANVKKFIETLPNGFPRYDTDLKLNMIHFKALYSQMILDLSISDDKKNKANNILTLITYFENWVSNVQNEYFMKKNEIFSMTILNDLQNIDTSYSWFEVRYGTNGTIFKDYNITTEDLIIFEATS